MHRLDFFQSFDLRFEGLDLLHEDALVLFRKDANPFEVRRQLDALVEGKVKGLVHDLVWLLLLSRFVVVIAKYLFKLSVLPPDISALSRILLLHILVAIRLLQRSDRSCSRGLLLLLLLLVLPLPFDRAQVLVLLLLIRRILLAQLQHLFSDGGLLLLCRCWRLLFLFGGVFPQREVRRFPLAEDAHGAEQGFVIDRGSVNCLCRLGLLNLFLEGVFLI